MKCHKQEDYLALQGPQVAPQATGLLAVIADESLERFIPPSSTQRCGLRRQLLKCGVGQQGPQRENWNMEERQQHQQPLRSIPSTSPLQPDGHGTFIDEEDIECTLQDEVNDDDVETPRSPGPRRLQV